MKIVIPEAIAGRPIERLGEVCTVVCEPDLWREPTRLYAAVRDADALIVRNQTQVNAALLRAAPALRVVGRAGAGLDNIDLDAAERAGVVVCAAFEENANSVAELVFAALLALARKLVPADRSTKAGGWDRAGATGIELYGRTLGLVGLGRIGFRVALRARAFGMKVLAYDPLVHPHSPQVAESGARLVPLEVLLRRSDAVSLHVPLTPKTHRMLDASRLALMKPSAVLINTARGGLVDEEALVAALRAGRLGGAALDVRSQEPPRIGALETFDNVVLTPHIGGLTVEAQQRVLGGGRRRPAGLARGAGASPPDG